MRGQRFHIDLDSDSDDDTGHPKPRTEAPQAASFFNLVKDVQERTPSGEVKPPSPPRLKGSATGFPAHRKRDRPSAFKQGIGKNPKSKGITQTEAVTKSAAPKSHIAYNPNGQSTDTAAELISGHKEDGKTERQRISDENDQRLAEMSQKEIEEARQELMSGLNPSIIEALLKKANLDDGAVGSDSISTPPPAEESISRPKQAKKTVTFEEPQEPDLIISNAPQPHEPSPCSPSKPTPSGLPTPSEHLDPSSPTFLASLHSKYFPSLPVDPSTLSWMQPLPPSSSYTHNTPSLPPSALRFDFRGHLLPPRLSAQLPSTMGLHHHSSAPGSAGYTIPELAHLARSTFPSQRCIAMQTLGRILYRLGRGDFGEERAEEGDSDGAEEGEGNGGDGEIEEGGGALCEGLWNEIERERVIDGLVEAAGGDGERGNRSVWVTATEAVWLWRKGGGRRLK